MIFTIQKVLLSRPVGLYSCDKMDVLDIDLKKESKKKKIEKKK